MVRCRFNQLERVEFADGTVWDRASFEARIDAESPESAPGGRFHRCPSEISTDEDALFNFQIPADAFVDAESLALSAETVGGGPLPSWLDFDATGTLSGLPLQNDVGSVGIRITATDAAGASAYQDLTLTVLNVNDAPTASGSIGDQMLAEGERFSLAVQAGTFNDPDPEDVLTLTATLQNGDPLPAWLSFDPETQTLSGTPAAGDAGVNPIRLVATDLSGATAELGFSLTVDAVEATNTIPSLAAPMGDLLTDEDQLFEFQIPAGTFSDADGGDTLTYTATTSDGVDLPGWLSFDPAAGAFRGTPSNADVGTVDVTVTATDSDGASTSDLFSITVANVNDAPVVSGGLDAQAAQELEAFSYQVPQGVFTDPDTGDALSYSAALADGTSLPSWLIFDPTSRTFAGTPASDAFGTISVRVSVADAAGAVSYADFDLDVAASTVSEPGQYIEGTSSADTLRGDSGDDEIYGGWGDDTLYGGAGDDRLYGQAGVDVLYGEDGDDVFVVTGNQTFQNDVFYGGKGFDSIVGGSGNDSIIVSNLTSSNSIEMIDGGSGTNTLKGNGSNNTIDLRGIAVVNLQQINGGSGNDTIYGTQGIDIVIGGNGDDALYGEDGDDVFIIKGTSSISTDRVYGGAGIDRLIGGSGDDNFRLPGFSSANNVEIIDGGDGFNAIVGNGSHNTFDLRGIEIHNIQEINGGGGNDTIHGTNKNDVIVGASGNDVMYGEGGNDVFFVTGTSNVDHDEFWGGEGLDTIQGGDADDNISVVNFSSQNGVERIDGRGGFNTLLGTGANQTIDLRDIVLSNIDEINGDWGNDTIYGSSNGERIVGSNGFDTLYGGAGSDTYAFRRGDDADTILNQNSLDIGSGAYSDSDDALRFEGDVEHDQLWFERSGDNLLVTLIGTNDEVTVQGWYGTAGNRLDRIETESGYALYTNQVEQLVSAMSSFAPPSSGQLTLPEDLKTDLQPVIATSWQATA